MTIDENAYTHAIVPLSFGEMSEPLTHDMLRKFLLDYLASIPTLSGLVQAIHKAAGQSHIISLETAIETIRSHYAAGNTETHACNTAPAAPVVDADV